MVAETKPKVSMEYRLQHWPILSHLVSPVFSIVKWLPGHDCDCNLCDIRRDGEWAPVGETDESGIDDVYDLDDAIEKLYALMGQASPEDGWRPAYNR